MRPASERRVAADAAPRRRPRPRRLPRWPAEPRRAALAASAAAAVCLWAAWSQVGTHRGLANAMPPPPAARQPAPGSAAGDLKHMARPVWWEIVYKTRAQADVAHNALAGSTHFGRAALQITHNEVDDEATGELSTVNVQNIDPERTEAEVVEFFKQCGDVVGAKRHDEVRFGLVVFKDEDSAFRAKNMFDGSELLGLKLRVEMDSTLDSLTRVIVHGLTGAVFWQQLREHFKAAGPIRVTTVHGGLTARVTFKRAEEAKAARSKPFDLARLMGSRRPINIDVPWDRYSQERVVRIRRLEDLETKCAGRGELEDVLRKHVGGAGEIVEFLLEEEQLPLEFMVPLRP